MATAPAVADPVRVVAAEALVLAVRALAEAADRAKRVVAPDLGKLAAPDLAVALPRSGELAARQEREEEGHHLRRTRRGLDYRKVLPCQHKLFWTLAGVGERDAA